MNGKPSELEFLPNEILIDIFQYFDARDLFRMFYDLNTRFNNLLQSLIDLTIVFTQFNARKIMHADIDPYCVQTMTLDRSKDIDLKDYSNLRRLKFLSPTLGQLDRFDSVDLPYLEYLYIYPENRYRFHLDLFDEYNRCYKIFSNQYPNLISCSLVNIDITLMMSNTIQSIKLRCLRVGFISFRSYQEILSICPNLDFLRFSFPSFGGKPLPKRSHLNLRRMIIDQDINTFSSGAYDIDDYFSCIPNLKKLCINHEKKDANISSYLTCNWFAKPIERYLLLLHRFKYRLHIYFLAELMKKNGEDILDRLEANFNRAHNYQYQFKLVFD
jgi:hypothetical protein